MDDAHNSDSMYESAVDVEPKIVIQHATQDFSNVLPAGAQRARTGDDSCFSVGSQSTTSSYQPTLSLAALALDQGMMGTTRVAEGDEGFINAYNMLLGIRIAVSTEGAKAPVELQSKHYSECRTFNFEAKPRNGSLNATSPFKFKDYAPKVFRRLREQAFGLDPADYLMSLTGKYVLSKLNSPGKSGSFFYYSRDCRFIIKTIHHSEHLRLRAMLKLYHKHVEQHSDTLVSRFFGLHRVTLPFGRKIHFLVMNNVFPALYEVHYRYDLKGSTLGRSSKGSDNPYVVYKDLDWLEDGHRIALGPAKRERLLKQLRLDVELLKECGVMDYSLLIGVHDLTKGNKTLDAVMELHELSSINSGSSDYGNVAKRETSELSNFQGLVSHNRAIIKELDLADSMRATSRFYSEKGGYQSTDEDDQPTSIIYFMGIIDFLTFYNTRKRLETKGKGVLHHKQKQGISAVPAAEYGERFFKFIKSQTGTPADGV